MRAPTRIHALIRTHTHAHTHTSTCTNMQFEPTSLAGLFLNEYTFLTTLCMRPDRQANVHNAPSCTNIGKATANACWRDEMVDSFGLNGNGMSTSTEGSCSTQTPYMAQTALRDHQQSGYSLTTHHTHPTAILCSSIHTK
ncbi:unnamed protein product [Ceratitis capitata]|uniref:(Mediterranean fruit fly) hypothetical protein n=1 Tax=Ceratitis capitata TaxID=7213 RepID=A0A811V2U7_CERCA|nr:unnamed protein product [Ceratitis capitata]